MHPWAGIKPSFMGNCKQSLCASWGTISIYKSPAEAVSKGDGKLFPVFFFFCAPLAFLFPLPCLSTCLWFFSCLSHPSFPRAWLRSGRVFNESCSLSLSPPLYAAPWALVIRHRSFHELLLSAFWNNRKKNKAPLQLAQVIIGCYYSVGAGLGGAWCMSSFPSQQSPSERSGVTRCPSCQPTSCPSCQLISTSRKLSLQQLPTQSQVSTPFKCVYNPNYI